MQEDKEILIKAYKQLLKETDKKPIKKILNKFIKDNKNNIFLLNYTLNNFI